MLTLIIALLISLGVIISSNDYNNLTDQEQQELIEHQDIIVEDDLTF